MFTMLMKIIEFEMKSMFDNMTKGERNEEGRKGPTRRMEEQKVGPFISDTNFNGG